MHLQLHQNHRWNHETAKNASDLYQFQYLVTLSRDFGHGRSQLEHDFVMSKVFFFNSWALRNKDLFLIMLHIYLRNDYKLLCSSDQGFSNFSGNVTHFCSKTYWKWIELTHNKLLCHVQRKPELSRTFFQFKNKRQVESWNCLMLSTSFKFLSWQAVARTPWWSQMKFKIWGLNKIPSSKASTFRKVTTM